MLGYLDPGRSRISVIFLSSHVFLNKMAQRFPLTAWKLKTYKQFSRVYEAALILVQIPVIKILNNKFINLYKGRFPSGFCSISKYILSIKLNKNIIWSTERLKHRINIKKWSMSCKIPKCKIVDIPFYPYFTESESI